VKVAHHCLELHGGNGVMLDFGDAWRLSACEFHP